MKMVPTILLLIASSGATEVAAQIGQDEKDPSAATLDEGSNYGGATPIGANEWLRDITFPEIQYVPKSVTATFDVSASGDAQNCQVRHPSPTRFEREICYAIEAKAKFEPARGFDGIPVQTAAHITVHFRFSK